METKIVRGFSRTPINYTYSVVVAIIFTIISAITAHFDLPFIGFSVGILMEEIDPTTGYFPILLLFSALYSCFYGVVIYMLQRDYFFEDLGELRNFVKEMRFPLLLVFVAAIFMFEFTFVFAISMLSLFLIILGLILAILGGIAFILAFGTVLVFEFLVFPLSNNVAVFFLTGIYIVLFLLYWRQEGE